jgi:DNA-binding NarL/FixJ family response regulator
MRQIFITDRKEPIGTWKKAFPEAEVFSPPLPGRVNLAPEDTLLVWFHVGASSKGLEVRIKSALAMAQGGPVVVLANTPNPEEGIAALDAGASGYASALASPDLLRQILAVVSNGGLWVGTELLGRLLSAIAARRPTMNEGLLDGLSPREREVALAVATGASNKEIARRLDITERTVKAHLAVIFDHLGVRDRLRLGVLLNKRAG